MVLRIKEALKWAQPYVHEYKAAFEASGGEIEETVEILLKDQIVLRRNCEAEVRYRMQRARYKGECFGHYTLCLPTERELKKALDAVSPDTDAVVERLNFMPSIQERETQAQRGVLRKIFKDALHDVVTSNKQWEKATTDPGGAAPRRCTPSPLPAPAQDRAMRSSKPNARCCAAVTSASRSASSAARTAASTGACGDSGGSSLSISGKSET